ncbi:MAG: hypothetical protein J6P94_03270 [Oscillospiraceae bacterium]|nr:hypothetical protein [Oscillospiraceae bacterium]
MNKKRLNKTIRRKANLDSDLLDRGYHSKMYHRHFEGYSEFETTNAKGKTVIKRVYTAEYYTLDLPKEKRLGLRVLCAALFILAIMLFLMAAARDLALNMKWYSAISQLGVLIGFAWTFGGLLSVFTAPRKMTIGDWKSSSRNLKHGSLCAAVFLELNAMISIMFLFFAEDWTSYFLNIGLYFAAGLVAVLLNRLEANAPYKTIPNDNTVPRDAVEIGE